MIKFTASKDGRRILGFGISRGNIQRLIAGDPIHLWLEEMGLPKTDLLIFFGETEEQIIKDLLAAGIEIDPSTATLNVVKAGAGAGQIASNPAGIDCGAKCAGKVPGNSVITLTAAPATGSMFAGWSGACGGSGPCNVTMNGPKTVTATFAASTPKPNPPANFNVTGECKLDAELANGSCAIILKKVP